MKKSICILVAIIFAASCIGCANTKIVDGKQYDTYGLINAGEKRNPNIEYELVVGNIIWSVILLETIVAPIYFIGFSMYQPVGKKGNSEPGVITN